MSLKKPIPSSQPEGEKKDEINKWFSEFIDDLKTDHLLLSENIATTEKKKLYEDIIFGDRSYMFSQMRNSSSMYYIANIINDYLKELKSYNSNPLKLAMGLSDSKILVWSVIKDNDDDTEDALLLAEAKVNGKYHQHGFYLNSTIIEESDKLPTPPHYQSIIG